MNICGSAQRPHPGWMDQGLDGVERLRVVRLLVFIDDHAVHLDVVQDNEPAS
jgi:hypothetical protein